MKYFLIAGERSGDLHGAFLVRKILESDPTAEITGYGGDQMYEAGMQLISHYKEISFMGFLEVIKNLRLISKKIKACEQAILNFSPDVLVLIDFPGFNLRMARFANGYNYKVAYYIAPKAWAWKESRVKIIKKYVDRLYSILPFEEAFFRRHNYEIQYVGNPVVEEIGEHHFAALPIKEGAEVRIAYLPGSRVQEVKTSVGMIVECARLRPDYHFIVAAVDNVDQEHYELLKDITNVQVFSGRTYDVLKSSDAAIVTSGTATLEAAILDIPQLVCYKTSKISYWIARALIRVRYLSLVNLIEDKRIVQEFVQDRYTPEIILSEIDKILGDEAYRQEMHNDYLKLGERIGIQSASNRVAEDLVKWLRS